jgi:hypothetical protein
MHAGGKDQHEGSKMEVLETMTAAKFDVLDNKVISQIQKIKI